MKVLAFGSCMSNLTIRWLESDYGFNQEYCIHHNRSDNFIRYFIDKSSDAIPYDTLDAMFQYKKDGEAEARAFLLNQYEKNIGFFELGHKRRSQEHNFFDDLLVQRVDLILIDNFMDIAAKLMYYKEDKKFSDSPLFLNFGFFQNESELVSKFDWWGDYLTPSESAENFARIARWFHDLQPSARLVFLPYHSCTSTGSPDRFHRAQGFYPELLKAMRDVEILIVPPLSPPPEYTKGEIDWPHFNSSLYRALAGHIFLELVGRPLSNTAALQS